MEKEDLIVVDGADNEIGVESKEKCHSGQGILHRAFSLFVFNDNDELLIQQRSGKKKTWPLFWSNSCCSHPNKGENIDEAAVRKMNQELGFSCRPKFLFKFRYTAQYNGWSENEIDHVLVCRYSGPVSTNKDEINDWRFVAIDKLERDININRERYTPWFRLVLGRVLKWYRSNKDFGKPKPSTKK